MGHNSFGSAFTVTTFGESHGEGLGVIIDGIESGFKVDLEALQDEMKRRRPGGNPLGTERNEQDELVILSGMYEGQTTGTPLAMVLYNTNHRSYDYSNLEHVFRPGHADWTFYKKFGVRDIRGGEGPLAGRPAPASQQALLPSRYSPKKASPSLGEPCRWVISLQQGGTGTSVTTPSPVRTAMPPSSWHP